MERYINGAAKVSGQHYQPAIDGLRALAILPVVAYHASPSLVPAGFLGVDVFFVISGYLITRLILEEMQRQEFSMVRFWERRARRLLPAALLMSFSCWLLGYFLLLPSEFRRLAEEVLSQSAFVSNVYFWFDAGYFSPKSDSRPLLHTWSLSLEEQFYLIAAPLLVVVWRLWHVKGAEAAIWLITLASLGTAIAWRGMDQDATFYLLPFRAWELGLGAIIAVRRPALSNPAVTAIAIAGLVTLLVAYFYFPAARSPSRGTLLATFATVALIISAGQNNPISKALSIRPLVWIGLISYSLYLWHWPALSFLNILKGDSRTSLDIVIALILSLMAALGSYYLLERPVRLRRLLAGRQALFVCSAISGAALVVLAFTTVVANGFGSRWSEAALAIAEGEKTRNSRYYECAERTLDDVSSKGFCRLGVKGNSKFGRVLVLGDSHGAAMMPLFDNWADRKEIFGWQAVRPRCKPLAYAGGPKSCRTFNKLVLDFISTQRPSDIILVGRWETADNAESYKAGLARRISELAGLGTRIWLVRQVPNPGFAVPENLARDHEFDWKNARLTTDRYLATTRSFEDAVIGNALPSLAGVLDPMPFFCDERECRLIINGRPAYTDDNHISEAAAISLVELLSPVTMAIARNKSLISANLTCVLSVSSPFVAEVGLGTICHL